jgi:hypothetical protein
MKLKDINKPINKFIIQKISMESSQPRYIADMTFYNWANNKHTVQKKYIGILKKAGVVDI